MSKPACCKALCCWPDFDKASILARVFAYIVLPTSARAPAPAIPNLLDKSKAVWPNLSCICLSFSNCANVPKSNLAPCKSMARSLPSWATALSKADWLPLVWISVSCCPKPLSLSPCKIASL